MRREEVPILVPRKAASLIRVRWFALCVLSKHTSRENQEGKSVLEMQLRIDQAKMGTVQTKRTQSNKVESCLLPPSLLFSTIRSSEGLRREATSRSAQSLDFSRFHYSVSFFRSTHERCGFSSCQTTSTSVSASYMNREDAKRVQLTRMTGLQRFKFRLAL